MSTARRLGGIWTAWRWPLLAGFVTYVVELILFRPLIEAYFPTNDEIAIEAISTPISGAVRPVLWLTQGFHGLFISYPEWGANHSDLVRPLANAVFWVHYALFGEHWGAQLAVGYLWHAIVVSLVTYIALSTFKLRPVYALMAVLIAALNPAMWGLYPSPRLISNMMQFPIFQTEVLCALLMLLAFFAFLHQRFVLFALAATTAILMKETALTVPASAVCLVGVWYRADIRQRVINLSLLLSPLILWGGLKMLIYQHGYATDVILPGRPYALLLQPLRNALLWPTGLYVGPLALTGHAISTHDWQIIAQHAGELLLNSAWWILLLIAAASACLQIARHTITRPEPWVVALFFAAGNLALVLALQISQLRYGYFWFALGPVALLAVLSRWGPGVVSAVLMTLGLVVPQGVTIARSLSSESLDYYREVKGSARQMTALLRTLPESVHKVYVVDELFINPISPVNVARFSGFHGEIVLINSLDPVIGCTPLSEPTARYNLSVSGTGTLLEYRAPPACLHWSWTGAPVKPAAHGAQVPRGQWLTYQFPHFAVTQDASTPGGQHFDVGQSWSVLEADPACVPENACLWLGLDAEKMQYYRLSKKSAELAQTEARER